MKIRIGFERTVWRMRDLQTASILFGCVSGLRWIAGTDRIGTPTPTLKEYAAQIVKADTFEMLAGVVGKADCDALAKRYVASSLLVVAAAESEKVRAQHKAVLMAAVTQSAGARVSVLFVCLIYIILVYSKVLEHLVVVYEPALYSIANLRA